MKPTQTPEASRRRLLFLCQTLPYPPDGGVAIRSLHVLRALAQRFDTTALCFYRRLGGRGDRNLSANLERLREICHVEAFPIPQEHDRRRLLWDHARSVVTGRPYTVFTYESSAFRERLTRLLADRPFDFVHIDSLDLSGYLPLLEDRPVVCVHHNVESRLLARRAQAERSLLRRAYLQLQARFTQREERRWCGRLELNVTVSDEDERQLRALIGEARTAVVPNGVDTETFRPASEPGSGLVFVGGTSWFPNRDALEYFCAEMLPRLRARGIDAPVTWVGHASAQERRDFNERHGITLTGYVDDIRPHVHAAACYVVPLRVGGGTRLKILDAWAMGKAVVSTSVGCEGLRVDDGHNMLVRDDPDGFVEAIGQVLTNDLLRRTLGRNGRATAEEHYAWARIGSRMLPYYENIVGA